MSYLKDYAETCGRAFACSEFRGNQSSPASVDTVTTTTAYVEFRGQKTGQDIAFQIAIVPVVLLGLPFFFLNIGINRPKTGQRTRQFSKQPVTPESDRFSDSAGSVGSLNSFGEAGMGAMLELRIMLLEYVMPFLMNLMTFLPWLGYAMQDEKTLCHIGPPGVVHFSYVLVLVLAVPGLCFLVSSTELELQGYWHGVTIYMTTVVASMDQMLNHNTAVLAKSCGYNHWIWIMVVLVMSLIIQGCTFAAVIRRSDNPDQWFNSSLPWLVMVGMNADVIAQMGTQAEDKALSLNLKLGVFYNPGAPRYRGVTLASRLVTLARFVTASIPQMILAVDFAQDRTLTWEAFLAIYVSVAVSFAMALRACGAFYGMLVDEDTKITDPCLVNAIHDSAIVNGLSPKKLGAPPAPPASPPPALPGYEASAGEWKARDTPMLPPQHQEAWSPAAQPIRSALKPRPPSAQEQRTSSKRSVPPAPPAPLNHPNFLHRLPPPAPQAPPPALP